LRLFLDANVLVDVALKRVDERGTPLWVASTLLLDEIYKGKHQGLTSVLSLYVVYVLVNPRNTKSGDTIARDKLRGFKGFIEVVDLTDSLLEESLAEKRLRFEDALQFVTARLADAEAIVTRNIRHFSKIKEEIRVLTPEELITQINR